MEAALQRSTGELINSRLIRKVACKIVYIEKLQLLLKMDMSTKKEKKKTRRNDHKLSTMYLHEGTGNPFPLHCYSIVTCCYSVLLLHLHCYSTPSSGSPGIAHSPSPCSQHPRRLFQRHPLALWALTMKQKLWQEKTSRR